MSELKGWWKGNVKDMRLRFPCLSFLDIENCPNLTSFAPYYSTKNLPEHDLPRLSELLIETCPNLASNLIFPSLEKLKLNNVNEGLLITCVYPQVSVTKQREMITDNLKSLRISYVTELTTVLWRYGGREIFRGIKTELCVFPLNP